jgi:hypothetical protein
MTEERKTVMDRIHGTGHTSVIPGRFKIGACLDQPGLPVNIFPEIIQICFCRDRRAAKAFRFSRRIISDVFE